ncbi:hypothetical protein Nwi_1607 [Nitrobacter winogradskyi Nb-255]|uniref:Uncharacterized protein n=2 Tax=Nitrobacter winogradskyi TaxID=913 RepID=Q3SS73_NITWN|nr:hypothetical protein Nwi_1607 [Nitrobacter winogradskyi Nb-255]
MSSWTLGARKPPQGDGLEIDIAIDGGDPLTLNTLEAETLETGLGKALAGVDNASGRISCVNAATQIIVAVDKVTVASLRYEKAERLRGHLKELLAGRGTEFADSGAVEDQPHPSVP